MKEAPTITIKQLHARTGAHVRRASKAPVRVTDRGKVVAVLAAPNLVLERKRVRKLLPEYAALLRKAPGQDVLEDLDAVRER